MVGAIWRSSGMEDANRQQRHAKAQGHGKEMSNDQTNETKAQSLMGKQRVETKFAVPLLSHWEKNQSQWNFFSDEVLGTQVLIINKHFDHAGEGTLKPEANR